MLILLMPFVAKSDLNKFIKSEQPNFSMVSLSKTNLSSRHYNILYNRGFPSKKIIFTKTNDDLIVANISLSNF